MTRTSEKGHAKNVDNLSLVIEVCKSLGDKYNPSKENFKLDNLIAKRDTCKELLQSTKTASQAENIARNNRKAGFKNKNKYATRLLAAIKVSQVSQETIADAISINKKIQGERITAEKKAAATTSEAATPTNNTISTSQQSYTNIVDHYKKYHTLISAIATDYNPNEEELKLTLVQDYITNLEALNSEVDEKSTITSNTIIARDKEFYNPITGIPDRVQGVKDYMKAAFGATSPEYKMIAKIKITRARKK
jgi:hypothetical protein